MVFRPDARHTKPRAEYTAGPGHGGGPGAQVSFRMGQHRGICGIAGRELRDCGTTGTRSVSPAAKKAIPRQSACPEGPLPGQGGSATSYVWSAADSLPASS